MPEIAAGIDTPNLPRRAARLTEAFGLDCYGCNRAIEVPAGELRGGVAVCLCGAQLWIEWRVKQPEHRLRLSGNS